MSKSLSLIILVSFLIAFTLGIAAWDINFWPSDEYFYYWPAAKHLFDHPYLSSMHQGFDEARKVWLHGKEMFILAAASVMKLIGDHESLKAFLIVLLGSVAFSAIFTFLIVRKVWGEREAIICWLLLVTSFWPYLYVMFIKHQPHGLFYFLAAVVALLYGQLSLKRFWIFILSGAFFMAALYSSNVSPLYALYLVLFGVYAASKINLSKKIVGWIKIASVIIALMAAGAAVIFLCVNWPNVGYNFKAYLEYIKISQGFNHFYYNQPTLQQWISHDIPLTRGGWLWIFKYFFLIMPVLLPLYLAAVIFLGYMCFVHRRDRRFIIQTSIIILVSFSTPVLVELKGVAQYGANYFTALIGFIFLMGYALHILFKNYQDSFLKRKKVQIAATAVLLLHIAVNLFVFATDIFPSRMATAFLSRKLKEMNVAELSIYQNHPQKDYVSKSLKPRIYRTIKWKEIQSVAQLSSGLIMLPPITKDSIYMAMQSSYNLYSDDLVLNNIIENGNIEDYAVASYPMLITSKIWAQEEEILAYRYLILDQFSSSQQKYGRAWLLDAQKLNQDINKFLPTKEQIYLADKHIYNIGKKTHLRIFEGYADRREIAPPSLKKILTRIYKVGNPKDSLVAYIYQFDDVQPVWIPVGKTNRSKAVPGERISSDPNGDAIIFEFSEAIALKPQPYQLRIYRTSAEDDQNFYRIYIQDVHPIQ